MNQEVPRRRESTLHRTLHRLLVVQVAAGNHEQEQSSQTNCPAGWRRRSGPTNRLRGRYRSAIEALHLSSGELVWQSDLNARPVVVFENLLAALSPVQGIPNALQLIEVDRKKGEFVRASDSLLFPDWVLATVAPNLSFSYEVSADGHDLIFE